MLRLLAVGILVVALAPVSLGKPFEKRSAKTNKVPIFTHKQEPFEQKVPADEQGNLYQGDMMLNEDQIEFLHLARDDSEAARYKRKALRSQDARWINNIVPYEFASSSNDDRTSIMAAIDHWSSLTCLTFQPYTSNQPATLGHDRRLQFFKGDGCWSYVGMQPQNTFQQISIGNGCTELGTTAHEIGHAMGFQHEQSRPDRDDHVEIFWDNIQTDMEGNFVKESLTDVYSNDVVPYDVLSVMHYGAYGFAKDTSKPTLATIRPFDMQYIGQREGLSYYDVKLANYIYNCNASCPQPLLACENEGFVDKSCTCQCPEGWTGTLCNEQSTEPSLASTVEITLTDTEGTFESPNYGTGNYPIDSYRMYYIKGAPGSTITLTFETFNLENPSTNGCWDYVQVNIDDPRFGGNKYCGSSLPPTIEATDDLMVWFYSDETNIDAGFRASYTIQAPTPPSTKAPTEAATTTKQPTEAATTPKATTLAATTAKATTRAATTAKATTLAVTTAKATTRAATTAKATTLAVTTTRATTQPAETTTKPVTTEFPLQYIQTPNYPNLYPANYGKVYKLTVDPGMRVYLEIVDLDIENSPECIYDSLVIDLGDPNNLLTTRLCGTKANVGPFVSVSNTMTLTFKSDAYVERRGFRASLKKIPGAVVVQNSAPAGLTGSCGGQFGGDTGTLASPSFPAFYPTRTSCEYIIEVASDKVVQLDFYEFDVEKKENSICAYDCLEVQLAENVNNFNEMPLSLDGANRPPGPIISQGNRMVLRFKSDEYVTKSGFAASYQAISKGNI